MPTGIVSSSTHQSSTPPPYPSPTQGGGEALDHELPRVNPESLTARGPPPRSPSAPDGGRPAGFGEPLETEHARLARAAGPLQALVAGPGLLEGDGKLRASAHDLGLGHP